MISPEIIELHHDKHHAAYVKGANDTLEQLEEARDKDQWGAINGLQKNLAFTSPATSCTPSTGTT